MIDKKLLHKIFYFTFPPVINDDDTITVDGSCSTTGKILKITKIPFQFKSVTNYYDIINIGLRTLTGSPESVGTFSAEKIILQI